MGYSFIITPAAQKDFHHLSSDNTQRIIEKLEYYIQTPNPLVFAKRLTGRKDQWRFRVGDYRVIFYVQDSTIFVLRVGHRSEIYL